MANYMKQCKCLKYCDEIPCPVCKEKEKPMNDCKFKVQSFYGNYIICHRKNGTDDYLWKDGTVHESLGLREASREHNVLDYADWPKSFYSLAPGYYRTEEEATTFLAGYLASQELIEKDLKFQVPAQKEKGSGFYNFDINEYEKSIEQPVEVEEDAPREVCLADNGCSDLEDCFPDHAAPKVIEIGDLFVNRVGVYRIVTQISDGQWGLIDHNFRVYMVGTREQVQSWANQYMTYVHKAEYDVKYDERPENVH